MLELGRAGSAGVGRGVVPVLRDGAEVATLKASNWKEQATAVIGEQEWVFAKQRGVLTARRGADPEGTAVLSARQTSWWKGSWALDLAGTSVEARTASMWKGTHRYLSAGRQIAESGRAGAWSSRLTLTADGLPLEQQVFLLWVELVISRRNAAATSGAVAGGAVAGSS